MHTTWYILEGGGLADPDDVLHGPDGRLQHKSGEAVAYGPHGPRSRGMSAEDIDAERAKAGQKAKVGRNRQMSAGAAADYETR